MEDTLTVMLSLVLLAVATDMHMASMLKKIIIM